MDEIKDKAILPDGYKRYIYPKRLASFGESSNRGKLTLNCVRSMQKYGINVPEEFEVMNHEIFKGYSAHERTTLFYYVRRVVLGVRSLFK